jgi:hypothetical protein
MHCAKSRKVAGSIPVDFSVYLILPAALRKTDMRFGLWNVRSLYRAGSLITVSRELPRYKLDLVGVQEVRWKCDDTEPAGEYIFFYGKGNDKHELGTDFFLVRESYQQLRGLSLLVLGCHT